MSFKQALDTNPANIIRPTKNQIQEISLAMANVKDPSDAEIIEACKKFLRKELANMDALARKGIKLVGSAVGDQILDGLKSLKGRNQNQEAERSARLAYEQGGFDPNVPVDSNTLGFGIIADARVIIGGQGFLGVGYDYRGRDLQNPTGIGFVATSFGFSLGASVSFAIAAFKDSPSDFSGAFFGVTFMASFPPSPLSCIVNVHVSPKLALQGFTVGIGLGAGSGASLIPGGARFNF